MKDVLKWQTETVSDSSSVTCGVPQGLVLGPLMISLYMLPLGQIIDTFKIPQLFAPFFIGG